MSHDKRKSQKQQPPPKKESSSSDDEMLLEIKKKYSKLRQTQQEEQPIKKKDVGLTKVGDPPVAAQNNVGVTTTHQLPFPKAQSGAYMIPLQLHRQYPHAIRLWIGNIPEPFDREAFQAHLRKSLEDSGGIMEPGDPISNIIVNPKFCFVQMRSIEETNAMLLLDGLLFQGKGLKIKRVSTYETGVRVEGERIMPKMNLSRVQIQKINSQVNDGPNKLYIGGLAPDQEEEGLIKILSEYGTLKGFLINRQKNKSYAFCEYDTELETMNCINGLNNKVIGGRLLQVKRGNQEVIDAITLQEQRDLDIKLATIERMKISSVIVIKNALRPSIEEDAEYNFVMKDIRRQIDKIGRLVSIVIPRRQDGHESGIGNIYMEFENEQYAKVAVILLDQQKYDGKIISVQFYDPRLYADKIY